MIRSAIVGCGAISKVHSQVLSFLPGIELVACADVLPGRAYALAEQHSCRAFGSFEEMLDTARPDVLHVLTPHYLHVPMAEEAAQKGIAVFMEKPPVLSRKQWDRLRALEGKVPIGICFQNRYNGTTKAVAKLLASGELGAVKGARALVCWSRDADYYAEGEWRGKWRTEGGGALINQAIHTLDLLVLLLGKPTGCETTMSNRHLRGVIEVEDTVESRILFGDASAIFYATTAHADDAPIMLEIACERGTVRIEGNEMTVSTPGEPARRTVHELNPALGKGYWGGGHVDCIEDFYRCLREKEPFPIGIRAVEDTVSLMLSMYEQGGMQPKEEGEYA